MESLAIDATEPWPTSTSGMVLHALAGALSALLHMQQSCQMHDRCLVSQTLQLQAIVTCLQAQLSTRTTVTSAYVQLLVPFRAWQARATFAATDCRALQHRTSPFAGTTWCAHSSHALRAPSSRLWSAGVRASCTMQAHAHAVLPPQDQARPPLARMSQRAPCCCMSSAYRALCLYCAMPQLCTQAAPASPPRALPAGLADAPARSV